MALHGTVPPFQDPGIPIDLSIVSLMLVGGIPTPLKNMNVNWDDYPQYMEK